MPSFIAGQQQLQQQKNQHEHQEEQYAFDQPQPQPTAAGYVNDAEQCAEETFNELVHGCTYIQFFFKLQLNVAIHMSFTMSKPVSKIIGHEYCKIIE